MRRRLERLLLPKTVAAIGGSAREDSPGYRLMQNLGSGFDGQLYAINPKYDEVQGFPCYQRLKQAPASPDVAVVCTPWYTLLDVVEDCGQANVVGMIILSSGPALDTDGKERLYTALKDRCRHYNMRMLGPSSSGVFQPHNGIRASLLKTPVQKGNLALITQSSALATAILDWADESRVGFSHVISVGAMLDIGFSELIDFLGTDDHTACILIYMENVRKARQFMSAARSFARTKPILVLRAGRSQELPPMVGVDVTGLATTDIIYSAALRRAGLLRVDEVSQFFNCAQALAQQARPRGRKLAIISNAGGPGLLAADYLKDHQGLAPVFTQEDLTALKDAGTQLRSTAPMLTLLRSAGEEDYRRVVQMALGCPDCDGLLVIYTSAAESDPRVIAQSLIEASQQTRKTILAAWMGETEVAEAREMLEAAQIPHYRFPEEAVDTFLRMFRYHKNLATLQETPEAIPLEQDFRTDEVQQLFRKVREEERTQLSMLEARQVLRAYRIPDNTFQLVQTREEALTYAAEIDYPVVLKIASPDLPDLSATGGIRLNLQDAADLIRAFDSLQDEVARRPEAQIDGILVEKMISKQFELVLAAKQDPVFGAVLIFGRGGRGVHLYPDLQVGLPPLNQALARRVIEQVRIFPLLKRQAGSSGIDLLELETILVRFAYLLADFPDIQRMDINPFVMNEEGGVALDAFIEISPEPPLQQRAYEHLVISPYPQQYSKTVQVKEGREMLLRPMRPEDEPLEKEMLESASRESLYYRFFGQVPQIDHQFLTRFTQNDYDREMAIVALEQQQDGTRKMAGVVRIVMELLKPQAEYAIILADPWHGLGLGSVMTAYILEIARDMGVEEIHASVMATNEAMLGLFKKFGFRLEQDDFNTYRAFKKL